MLKRREIGKVVLIGSGPVHIGEPAKFDFSGPPSLNNLLEVKVQAYQIYFRKYCKTRFHTITPCIR